MVFKPERCPFDTTANKHLASLSAFQEHVIVSFEELLG